MKEVNRVLEKHGSTAELLVTSSSKFGPYILTLLRRLSQYNRSINVRRGCCLDGSELSNLDLAGSQLGRPLLGVRMSPLNR
ncbi:hypothetical protein J6590_063314 [Homalodisca vitripennis]|nr:hypothetical protein J6590_063314 [Homalodisca vitripennis]